MFEAFLILIQFMHSTLLKSKNLHCSTKSLQNKVIEEASNLGWAQKRNYHRLFILFCFARWGAGAVRKWSVCFWGGFVVFFKIIALGMVINYVVVYACQGPSLGQEKEKSSSV